MASKCARCGGLVEEEPGTSHVLCGQDENNCWEEAGCVGGDYDTTQGWWAVRNLGEWVEKTATGDELKELADSSRIWQIVEKILYEKDMGTKINWLRKEVNKLT